jgi:hypothetical protein
MSCPRCEFLPDSYLDKRTSALQAGAARSIRLHQLISTSLAAFLAVAFVIYYFDMRARRHAVDLQRAEIARDLQHDDVALEQIHQLLLQPIKCR